VNIYIVTRFVHGAERGVVHTPNLGVHTSQRSAENHFSSCVTDRNQHCTSVRNLPRVSETLRSAAVSVLREVQAVHGPGVGGVPMSSLPSRRELAEWRRMDNILEFVLDEDDSPDEVASDLTLMGLDPAPLRKRVAELVARKRAEAQSGEVRDA